MKREHPLKPFYEIIDNGDIRHKLKNIPEFPRIIEFEVTNHCNFHCLMCKTGVGTALRQRGFMTIDTFQKVIDQIKGKGAALKFVGQGEPLMHKECMEYIQYAKENKIVCHVTTNGSFLSEDIMDKMIDVGLDSIKFSFQGINKEGYKLLRQKDNFEELLETIKRLYEKRGEKEYPYITICTSITDETNEEIEVFKKRCNNICDNIEVGITTMEFIEFNKIKNEESKKVLKRLQQIQLVDKKRYKCCHQVFDVITIRWNGDITACCADNDGIMTLGSIHQKSILECWNSSKEKKYRKILSENRYDDLILCRDCYDIMGYTTNN